TMRGFNKDGTTVILVLLNLILFETADAEKAIFTNHFLVQLHEGEDVAKQVAADHGFNSGKKLPFAEGLFHFYHNAIPKARRRRSLQHIQRLEKDPRVKNVLQQAGFGRKKRGYRDINEIDVKMNDPLFTKQWYLINTGQADGTPGLDLNVAEAWELGFTGKGVTIAIMDDGMSGEGADRLSEPTLHVDSESSGNPGAPPQGCPEKGRTDSPSPCYMRTLSLPPSPPVLHCPPRGGEVQRTHVVG
ncbi:UNVERIFIED_CONTAM: hypothetical protein FKN15_015826, partial [Acipenser sinensis]